MSLDPAAGIPYPLSFPDHRGRPYVWQPYAVRFTSPDGTFECHIYAISLDHAELQLQALRETGHLSAGVSLSRTL